jgi:hypothetical protein
MVARATVVTPTPAIASNSTGTNLFLIICFQRLGNEYVITYSLVLWLVRKFGEYVKAYGGAIAFWQDEGVRKLEKLVQ